MLMEAHYIEALVTRCIVCDLAVWGRPCSASDPSVQLPGLLAYMQCKSACAYVDKENVLHASTQAGLIQDLYSGRF